jgi:transposase
MAAEELADLVTVDAKLKAIKKELRDAVAARGSHLMDLYMDLYGVGPAGAARILVDVGDVTRFADRNRFAACPSTDRHRALGRLQRRTDPPPTVPGR